MRSTYYGTLSAFGLFLFCFPSVPVFAQAAPPNPNNFPPGQAGNLTERATTFAIDRSPMSTSVSNVGRFQRFRFQVNRKPEWIDLTGDSKSIIDQIDELLRTDNTRKPSIIDRFVLYVKDQLAREQQYGPSLRPYTNILLKSRENLQANLVMPPPPNATFILEGEILRLRAMSSYLNLQFIKQDEGFVREVRAIELQTRSVAGQTVHLANLLYSNAQLRSDFSAQYIYGAVTGFGGGWNYDLIGAAVYLYDNPEVLETLAGDDFKSLACKMVDSQDMTLAQGEKRLTEYLLKPHAGFSFDYRKINDIGEIYSTGLTFSLFHPLHGHYIGTEPLSHKTPGLFLSAGWRHNWFEGNAGNGYGNTKGIGFSAVVAWQDAIPFLYTNTEESEPVLKAELARWRWRAGIEYSQRNALVSGDYFAVFARWRDNTKRKKTSEDLIKKDWMKFELGVHVGVDNGYGFVGGSVGFYFR